MASTSQLAATVNEDVVTVRNEKQKAIDALRTQWFGGEGSKNAASAINSLTAKIEGWAAKGIVGAAANKAPYVAGWGAWVKDGRNFIDGIHDIFDIGDKATLKDVAAVIKEAPSHAVKDVTKATTAVASVVGNTAAALVTPIMGPLVVVVAVAVAVALLARHFRVI